MQQSIKLAVRIDRLDEYMALIQKAESLLDEFDKTWSAITGFEFDCTIEEIGETNEAG